MTGRSIEGSVALVTGSNRGIGRAIVEALVARGASKVYAGARNTEALADLVNAYPGKVEALELDVTNAEQITKAAEIAKDVDLLINNAGVAGEKFKVISDAEINAFARVEFEVNVFGVIGLTQAFIPILESNGGGTLVNLGSVASFVNFPILQSYSASKAAVHSLTQATRAIHTNTLVVGVYPGPVDTDMAEGLPMDKVSPESVAQEILDGIEAGTEEVFPDPMAKEMGGFYLQDPKGLERQVASSVEA